MIRAELETSHFTFEAYGNTEEEALATLKGGWEAIHRKQYPDAVSFDEFVEDGDVGFCEVEVGKAYRDNEELKVPEEKPIPLENLAKLYGLLETARPTSEDDWGTERQIDAENKFFAELEKAVTEEQWATFEDGQYKATTDEMLDNAMRLLRLAK